MSAIRPGKRSGGRTFTFHHITLRVTDLRRARAFYEGVLGLTVDQDFPDEKLRLRLNGTTTRLVLRPPLPGTPISDRFAKQRIGLDHVAIGVPVGKRPGWPDSLTMPELRTVESRQTQSVPRWSHFVIRTTSSCRRRAGRGRAVVLAARLEVRFG